MRRNSFAAACLFAVVLCSSVAAAAERKPNVIIILADDLGYADVGFDGRREWATPNLDRLAAQGTIFRRWYTAAVVCAPSRAALMTGRYGIHNGVTGNGSLDLPSGEITIAEALKARGYATGIFGKWHHGAPRPGEKNYTHPMDQGFNEFFGFTDAVHAWQKFPKELWDGREMRPSEGYADTLFTDRSIDFLKRHKGEPFFLYVAFICPHGKPAAPQEEIDAFKDKYDLQNATYAAEIVRMDKDVGRLMKALDELNLDEQTLVIFTSDHGATFEKLAGTGPAYFDSNRPFRGQKRTLWEGGMRVPAVVRWSGKLPAGTESHDVMHMCDLFPTLLAAAGEQPEPKWKIDGANMLDVWRGAAKPPDRTLFWEWREGDTQFAAMHGNLKMVITGDNNPELFDVERDPQERINLQAQYPDELKKMEERLKQWLATETDAARQKKKSATTNSGD